MYLNLYMMFLMFLMSCLMYSFYYKHILLTLVSLEFMMINLTLIFYLTLSMLNMNLFFLSFFLGIMVCEAVIGLSILVYLIRLIGNDYMILLSIIKW